MANKNKGFLGWTAIKKTAGQATPAVGTQYSFPAAQINPRNPRNKGYLPCVNVNANTKIVVLGKKTPSIVLSNLPLKASFLSPTLISALIASSASWLDSNLNSDEWAVGVHNGSYLRVYDGCKCVSLAFTQMAQGGPILLDMAFLAQYGDSEKAVPTTFSTPTCDFGSAHDVTKVDFNSTANAVESWRATLMRAQGHQHYCDGTLYSDTLQTGMFGGNVRLQQSPLASTIPSTALTIKIGDAGSGTQLDFALSHDEYTEDVMAALGTEFNDYTLFQGANCNYPVTVASF